MEAIDTVYPVETPDGIALAIRPSGPVLRAAAWMIDAMIRSGLIIIMIIGLSFLDSIGFALMLIGWFLINWWYPVLFEVLAHGATPGKKALGLTVINADGTPVGWGPAIVRNLLRQIDFLPFFYTAGLVTMLCNRRFQRLGDLAAGTVVIYVARPPSVQADIPDGPAEPPPLSLDPAQQQALLSFGERSRLLNPERSCELANLLEPVTGAGGEDGVQRVLAWSRWIRGQQA
jgi:uncharacterized RDD family membrane protein YckC